eukprot:9539170-Karenia_brevis.AAC.1
MLQRPHPKISWEDKAGTPVKVLRQQLRMQRWEERGPFEWQHLDTAERLELGASREDTKEEKRERSHKLRDGFRALQWARLWKTSKRHDVEELKEELGEAPEFPKERARAAAREAEKDAARHALLCGAVMSPACMQQQRRSGGQWTTRCVACEELGTHKHIFCECPKVCAMAGMRRPRRVECPLQRRWGWPTGLCKQKDEEVLKWMSRVAVLIWEQRYGDAEKRDKMMAAIQRRKQQRQQQSREQSKAQQVAADRWQLK